MAILWSTNHELNTVAKERISRSLLNCMSLLLGAQSEVVTVCQSQRGNVSLSLAHTSLPSSINPGKTRETTEKYFSLSLGCTFLLSGADLGFLITTERVCSSLTNFCGPANICLGMITRSLCVRGYAQTYGEQLYPSDCRMMAARTVLFRLLAAFRLARTPPSGECTYKAVCQDRGSAFASLMCRQNFIPV